MNQVFQCCSGPQIGPNVVVLLHCRCDDACDMQVESMSTAELQQQLQACNINTQGLTKFDLQDSLWASLQAEAGLLPAEDAAVS